MNKSVKYLLIILGSISLALGFLGMFLPILPTTPFLLLTSYCYIRGSKGMHDWLMNNKRFGPYLDDYFNKKGITKRNRFKSIGSLWIGISISAYLVDIVHLRIFLLFVAIGVTIHLCRLKTL